MNNINIEHIRQRKNIDFCVDDAAYTIMKTIAGEWKNHCTVVIEDAYGNVEVQTLPIEKVKSWWSEELPEVKNHLDKLIQELFL